MQFFLNTYFHLFITQVTIHDIFVIFCSLIWLFNKNKARIVVSARFLKYPCWNYTFIINKNMQKKFYSVKHSLLACLKLVNKLAHKCSSFRTQTVNLWEAFVMNIDLNDIEVILPQVSGSFIDILAIKKA